MERGHPPGNFFRIPEYFGAAVEHPTLCPQVSVLSLAYCCRFLVVAVFVWVLVSYDLFFPFLFRLVDGFFSFFFRTLSSPLVYFLCVPVLFFFYSSEAVYYARFF